ncbi:MAG: outer membrane beta-barrel family protein [Bacteroidia bacterium]|nr:outer membrane beta-barrel family protein [Bacteroidia bacterium]
MLKRFFVLFIGLISIAISALAETGNVKGLLKDADNGQPIEFATIAITDTNGKMVTGGITDIDGAFNIPGLKVGKYTITCSYMGYTPITFSIDITNEKQTANVGTRKLQPEVSQLDEVKVTGKASQMRFELDRKVFDASNNIAAEGGSASDLLATVPSVEVDNDGAVSLRGNSSVTIWINGKASGLSADNQGDILQLLPADNIKQIEVITNPSAKYSPEGSAGIINIILKDERTSGYFGSLKAGANTNGGYNASGNINVNISKWEFGLDVSRRHREMHGGGEAHQEVLTTGEDSRLSPLSVLEEKSDTENSGGNWFGRFKMTFHPTPKNDIGIVVSGMKGDGEGEEEIDYTQYGDGKGGILSDKLYYTSKRETVSDRENKMGHLEFNYRHTFTDDHMIDFSVSRFTWNMDNAAVYTQGYDYTDDTADITTIQIDNSGVDDKGTEVQLDYSVKIADIIKLEAGYKGNFTRNGSNTERVDRDNTYTLQDFQYDQDTHAGYLTLGGKIGDMSIQGGLRAEQWEFTTEDETHTLDFDKTEISPAGSITRANKDFFKLFPSLFISYALPSGNEIQVNYTRRLRRPWGGQLNPARQISDAHNIRFGNPGLTPEYTNAFELNYIKMWESGQTVSFSAYYRSTKDVMDHISFTQGNIRYNTQANVSDRKSLGTELVGKNRISTWFELTTTLNMFYQKIEAYRFAPDKAWLEHMTGSSETTSVVEGDEKNTFNWNMRMIANITLPADISLQATGMYRGKSKGVQGYTKPMGGLDLGIKKSFLKDKLVLNINGRNVLNTSKFRNVFESDQLYQESKRWRNGCVFNCTLTWKFGNLSLNKKKGGPEGEGGGDDEGISYSGGVD